MRVIGIDPGIERTGFAVLEQDKNGTPQLLDYGCIYTSKEHEFPARLASLDGVDRVVPPEALQLDHPRSGELIALAARDAWFHYYYWLDDARAPDFARTVDIHRKPGYDPCELFMTSKARAALRLAQKATGLRYRMDVVPLDPSLVRGSHGLPPADPADGPCIIGPGAPDDMRDFKEYVRGLCC